MELNKNHDAGGRARKVPLANGSRSVDLTGDFVRLGSALPKSKIGRVGLSQTIKPPSQIAANPILKAAKKIDLQTASIPWQDLATTVKESKSNFSRIKEIYLPTHHHSSSSSSVSTQKPQSRNNLNNKPKHVKTESRETRSEQTKSMNIFGLYSKSNTAVGFHKPQRAEDPDQANSISLDNLNWSKNRRLGLWFGSRKSSLAPSFHLVKLKRHSIASFYESTKSSNSSLDTNCPKAPYSAFLKGKKLRRASRSLANSDLELTPNHFLNK